MGPALPEEPVGPSVGTGLGCPLASAFLRLKWGAGCGGAQRRKQRSPREEPSPSSRVRARPPGPQFPHCRPRREARGRAGVGAAGRFVWPRRQWPGRVGLPSPALLLRPGGFFFLSLFFFFLFFFFWQGRRVETFGSFAPSSHSPAEPPGGLGVGARGAGAGERGLKASQALQRPTRACTPPPVPAEKSSSYPRLHRSAFLFQSAGRLAAPPFSGQARCLERAPLLHLLARLLAPLPGPARRPGAGGGFAREPACFPLPLLPPCCLLPPASLLRLSNSPLSPLACV